MAGACGRDWLVGIVLLDVEGLIHGIGRRTLPRGSGGSHDSREEGGLGRRYSDRATIGTKLGGRDHGLAALTTDW